MVCVRVLHPNDLTYAEQCVKILCLCYVSYLICPGCLRVVPFVTFSLFHSLTLTHKCALVQVIHSESTNTRLELCIFPLYRSSRFSDFDPNLVATFHPTVFFPFVTLHQSVHLTSIQFTFPLYFSCLSYLSLSFPTRQLVRAPLFFYPTEPETKNWSSFSLHRGRWIHLWARINE